MRRTIRALLACVAGALLLAPPASAQSQEDYKERYAEKLTHEFIGYGGWLTDYDEARARAKKEGKVLFVYFSRSYAP